MDQKRAVMIVVMAILSSPSLASATEAVAGFTTPAYTPSTCFGKENKGDMIALLGGSMWNNGAYCGKTISVTCIDEPRRCKSSSPVDAIVVGYCSNCDNGIDFRLSDEAFDQISFESIRHAEVDYVIQ
ncbi:hypothetical protein IEQ34_013337 [Dendrobium chrysotoxum]|uniref:Expansin-like EG45 domain-containing protein n=1 Tax=Dendrobium chrysotoxum TaxID=161865 RepID=A0AAV7GNZ8_DENCH|nr:hypothetical protein IEQ34_013337 [Dendrobium chrysotoxum]